MDDIGQVVLKLSAMGYRLWLEGDRVGYEHVGPGEPDVVKVLPLLKAIRERKADAVYFLRCYCPCCGGVVFGTFSDGKSRCLVCYWKNLDSLIIDRT
jgi:hypothetical protein